MFKNWITFSILCLSAVYQSTAQQEVNDTVAYSLDLDEYVITGQYRPTAQENSLHQVSTITDDQIQKLGATTLEKALTLLPSIRLGVDPVLGTTIRMRGMSGRNVAILIDGVPMIGRNGGNIDLSQFPLHTVQKIEIVEGPLSNLYGNNAAGGVINLITKKSQLSDIDIAVGSQVESIGIQNHNASIGLQNSKHLVRLHGRFYEYDQHHEDSLRLLQTFTRADSSTYKDFKFPLNPKTQKSYGGLYKYRIDNENAITAKYDFNIENVVDYGATKRPQFRPYADDQYYDTRRTDMSLLYDGVIKNRFYTQAVFSKNKYQRLRDDKRYYHEEMAFDTIVNNADSIRFDQYFGRVHTAFDAGQGIEIAVGSQGNIETGRGDRIIDYNREDSLTASLSEYAFYTDLKYTGLKNTSWSLSSRAILNDSYENAFTYSLMGKFRLSDDLSARASYAKGYRSPDLKELYIEFIDINHYIVGNPDLIPERSSDLQFALEYQDKNYFGFTTTLFHTRVKDRITLATFEPQRFNYQNIDNYHIYGFQPAVHFSHVGFTIESSFSLNFWSSLFLEQDSPQFGRAVDVNNNLTYSLPSQNLTFFVNHRYVGDSPIFSYDGEAVFVDKQQGYHIMDASVSKSFFEDQLTITCGARNILNTTNTQITGESGGGAHSGGSRSIIGTGRSFFLSVSTSLTHNIKSAKSNITPNP